MTQQPTIPRVPGRPAPCSFYWTGPNLPWSLRQPGDGQKRERLRALGNAIEPTWLRRGRYSAPREGQA